MMSFHSDTSYRSESHFARLLNLSTLIKTDCLSTSQLASVHLTFLQASMFQISASTSSPSSIIPLPSSLRTFKFTSILNISIDPHLRFLPTSLENIVNTPQSSLLNNETIILDFADLPRELITLDWSLPFNGDSLVNLPTSLQRLKLVGYVHHHRHHVIISSLI